MYLSNKVELPSVTCVQKKNIPERTPKSAFVYLHMLFYMKGRSKPIVVGASNNVLQLLPYDGCTKNLAEIHGQFNNSFSSPYKTKRGGVVMFIDESLHYHILEKNSNQS